MTQPLASDTTPDLTDQQVRQATELLASGKSQRAVAEQMGVTHYRIRQVYETKVRATAVELEDLKQAVLDLTDSHEKLLTALGDTKADYDRASARTKKIRT